MGRINNSVEIIPIDGPSGLHSRQISREVRTQPQYLQRVKTMPYISDPYIVARVQQYLEMNVDRTFVDIAEMADYLQKTYREYGKRKRSAFRGMVKKAYAIISRNYGNKASSSESDVEDLDDEAEEQNNSMNNQLILMYNNRPGQQQQQQLSRNLQHLPQPTASEEAIDISSDEESDNIEIPPVPPLKKENGPPPPLKLPKLVEMSSSSTASVEKIVTSTPQQPDRIKKRKSDQTQVIYPKRKKDAETETKVTFQDVGGMDKVLEDVCKLLVHIKHPEVYRQIGITPPRGFLLHGPPGCGKTLLANAIAGELDVAFIKVAAPELVAGVSGESEGRIRELFERAVTTAPCVLFIDEIDAITQNRQQAQKEMERRIVAQLLSCLDELGNNENGDRVLVIGATNRPDSLDPALRRAGRFDREVCLGIPNLEAREQILRVLTSKLKLTPDFDYKYIAKNSPGYVGADLMALTREAAMAAIDRVFSHLNTPILSKSPTPPDITEPIIVLESNEAKDATKEDVINTEEVKPVQDAVTQTEKTQEVIEIPTTTTVSTTSTIPEAKRTTVDQLITWLHGQAPLTTDQLNELSIEMVDFRNALKSVQPSAKREGFATVPGVTWEDVGSLQDIREELQMSILAPVRYPEQFKSLGITTPAGVLLCGPPGCGKTLLAKAIANEAGINFISVKGPELLNMYVGESERAVRQCFQRARSSVPCVIFFDELDALCPKRSDSGEGGASMRVVNQMLTEMDGIEDRAGVFLMAASNRPDIVDPAVLRPGRLDKILYVGLPTPEDRVDILRAITKKGTQPLLAPDVDLEAIGKCEPCNGYTGADLAALVREAGIQAMKDLMLNTTPAVAPITLTNDHFQKAILKIRPSVTEKDQKHYEKIRKQYIRIKDVAVPTEEEIMECS